MATKDKNLKKSADTPLVPPKKPLPSKNSPKKSQLLLTFFLILILLMVVGGGLFWGYSSGMFQNLGFNGQNTTDKNKSGDNNRTDKAQPRLSKVNPQTDVVITASGFEVVANVVEVVWKSPLSEEQQRFVFERIPGDEVIRGYLPEIPLTEISVADGTLMSVIELLKQQPEVAIAMVDYLADETYEPLDPDYQTKSKKWWLEQVEAEQAWDISQGDPDMFVAVIDGGFQFDHPDLSGKFDEFFAINLSSEDYDDNPKHGTHVSGIIAMDPNNVGLVGMAPNVKIMAIKMETLPQIADAIKLATDNGAKVISISQGFNWWRKNQNRAAANQPPFTPAEMKTATDEIDQILLPAVRYAKSKGVVIVHSAGNDSQSAAYNSMNTADVITVANSDSADALGPSSNFGNPVTLAAPGTEIWSTVGGSSWEYLSGTSMATPLVAGTVALVRAANTQLTVDQIIAVLQRTAQTSSSMTHKRLNAWQALLEVTGSYGVKGKVVDSQGNPISGVKVETVDQPEWGTTTKPDGTFALAALRRDGSWKIKATKGDKEGFLELTPLPADQWVVRDVVVILRSLNEPQFESAFLSFSSGSGEHFDTTCAYTDPSYANILGCDAAGNCTSPDELQFRFDGDISLSPPSLAGPFTGTLSPSWQQNYRETEVNNIVFSGDVGQLAENGLVTLDITGTRGGYGLNTQEPIHAVVAGTIVKIGNQNDLHYSYTIRTDNVTIDPYTLQITNTSSGTCTYAYDPDTHSMTTRPQDGYFSIRVDYILPAAGTSGPETDALKGLGL